jgi:hypothetical protein
MKSITSLCDKVQAELLLVVLMAYIHAIIDRIVLLPLLLHFIPTGTNTPDSAALFF